ncbi:ATP/GTP-binding protein [Streptomyces sp. NPDC003038]|uniref:GTP-binding protein n=1 Tax=unclassified Streptomyces TaxID=2593676 RepID=UPI0033A1D36C
MAYISDCDADADADADAAAAAVGVDATEGAGGGAGASPPATLKILIAGGFGAGKTTFVGAVSEIEPLSTEELLSGLSESADALEGVEAKTATTVALDFGRITLDERHVLYLFGTPGQQRFWFLWEEMCVGALGAVVLADTRRLADCFPAVDFFERRGIGFIVAVNEFDGAHRYTPDEVRAAVGLGPGVPVVRCDARSSSSGTGTLAALVRHLLNTSSSSSSEPGEPP